MDIMKFITENALQMVAVFYVLGAIIKNTTLVKDKFIPLVLITISLAVTPATVGGYMDPQSYVQAVLVVGAAVLVNELPKQLSKAE